MIGKIQIKTAAQYKQTGDEDHREAVDGRRIGCRNCTGTDVHQCSEYVQRGNDNHGADDPEHNFHWSLLMILDR